MTSPSWRPHGPAGSETGNARVQAIVDNLLRRGKEQDAEPARTDDLTNQEGGSGKKPKHDLPGSLDRS